MRRVIAGWESPVGRPAFTARAARIRRSGGEWLGVRAVFVLYLVLIASGIAFYAVIGLTHN
jgi:hypothetical protein